MRARLEMVLPLGLKTWLRAHAQSRGLGMTSVIILALEQYRRKIEAEQKHERVYTSNDLADKVLP